MPLIALTWIGCVAPDVRSKQVEEWDVARERRRHEPKPSKLGRDDVFPDLTCKLGVSPGCHMLATPRSCVGRSRKRQLTDVRG